MRHSIVQVKNVAQQTADFASFPHCRTGIFAKALEKKLRYRATAA